jgi:2-polyprenyl-3-methyl-5-hydroxy-6-metoxy-1,4-benzoquinol methylase
MAELAPSTSAQIADASGLQERYVREWLGAMVTGRIIEYSPDTETYALPPEHAAVMTRAAGADNLARTAQYVALLGNVEQAILEAFRRGGGVSYDAYPRFQELMAEESAAVYDDTLIDRTLPLIPGLRSKLEEGIEVLDVGCGRGHTLNLLAGAFHESRFVGFDLSAEGIAAARSEARHKDLRNATFEQKDLSTFETTTRWDLITAFDVIHDLARPTRVLAAIYEALKPGGTFLMVDIAASSHVHENLDHPFGPLFYTVSTMHCMTVSLSCDGEGLGTMWGEQLAVEKLKQAGFIDVEVHTIDGDPFNNYYVAKKA